MSAQKGTAVFKKWWFWVIVAVVVIGIIANASDNGKTSDANGSEGSASNSIDASSVPATVTQFVLATPTPAFDWSSADINEQNVRLAIQDIPVLSSTTIEKVIIEPGSNTNSYKITITIDPATSYGGDNFVRVMMEKTIQCCEVLFQNSDVESVAVHDVVHLKDSYGKSSTDDTSFVMFTRETAQKLDYEGFADNAMGDYTRCYRVADSYYIHNAIYKKLEESKGMSQSK